MTRYRIAAWLRPVLLLHIPLALYLGYFQQQFFWAGLWLLAVGVIGFALRCRNCGNSIYFEKKSPYKTVLARPHRVCTVCGTPFDGLDDPTART